METTWQKSFSLSFVLGKPNKANQRKVYLRYYSQDADILLEKSTVRIETTQFNPDNLKVPVKDHPNAKIHNANLNSFRIEVEARAAKLTELPTKELLLGQAHYKVVSERITDFIDDYINLMKSQSDKDKGRLSSGRIRIYRVVKGKIEGYDKKATFSMISLLWMQKFEQHIRKTGISDNTVNSNMTVFKAILNRAADQGLLDRNQFQKYTPPAYEMDIPVYLEESEIDSFYEVVKTVKDREIKTCGYYFLLACYAGYRISDLYAFNYTERVRGNTIVLRAQKNGKIVTTAIYPRLKEILDYCKDHKIGLSEEHMRKKVKAIASLAGISGRNIKVHSGRHSFAMMMLNRGLTVDEVAELLGDSVEVAKRYARITNKHLHRRVLEVMT